MINDSLKAKVRQTLGCFEKGSAGNLIQSSPYRLVVLQQLLPEGKVFASRPRLQIARENDPNFMSGFYVDCGLNLVPCKDAGEDSIINPIQARELEADLKNIGLDLKYAKLIPYHILTSEVNDKSPSGLVFKLSKKGKDNAKGAVLNTEDFHGIINLLKVVCLGLTSAVMMAGTVATGVSFAPTGIAE